MIRVYNVWDSVRIFQRFYCMSHIMRKHGCLNMLKQRRLCFRYIYSAVPLLPKPLAIFCGYTVQFVMDLVGNPKDRFSHDSAHIVELQCYTVMTLSFRTDRSGQTKQTQIRLLPKKSSLIRVFTVCYSICTILTKYP